MRLVLVLLAFVFVIGCSHAVDPVGLDPRSMPDTISCERAVIIKAANTDRGIAAERRWLAQYYPRHSNYAQSLAGGAPKRIYDVLTFRTRDGREASICFDVTSFYGQW